MSTRRRVYEASDSENPTIRLKARTCPPQEQPHSQDPGSAVKRTLFLGLFDVTRRCTVAVRHCLALFGLFGTVLAVWRYSISLDGRYTGP